MIITVCAEPPEGELEQRARALADQLSLPIGDAASAQLSLVVTPSGLELRERAAPRSHPLRVDFNTQSVIRRIKAGAFAGEMLVRAMGKGDRQRTAIDATAGLGRDAFLLASAGFEVTAVERHGVLAALLEDGIGRGREAAALAEPLSRLRLVHADSRVLLGSLEPDQQPDLIYIDTMFPERTKSAQVKKEMRLCRLLAGEDPDAPELLDIARRTARNRVVVKRGLRSPPMGEVAPSHNLRGTTIRYDVYISAR